ncbi:MAG TPA: hypothetical protein VGR02_09425 [Thermoanaerobaculia bacterium]|jgi:hypothetical protein|nr:hypothetical protein [Thermoanaerobaculia bacterium]
MKHGDNAKAKAASKTSSGKSSKAAGEKGSSAKEAGTSSKAKDSKASGKQAGAGGEKAPARGNGKSSRVPVPPPEAGTFTNPVVEDAFKRAIKKYPNAFRRLTD